MNHRPPKIISLIRKWPRATFFLYLAAFIVSLLFIKYPAALQQARSSTLNRFMPNFDYLVLSQIQQENLDKKKMQEYFDYYQLVDIYMPNRADTQGTLGYCAYALGKEDTALNFYKRAVQLFPQSFAFQYNLGALYFKRGQYEIAKNYFTQALQTDPRLNLQFTFTSRLYYPLLPPSQNPEATALAHVKLQYERCFRLLVLTLEKLGKDEPAFQTAVQATLQSFPDDTFFYLHAGKAAYRLGWHSQTIAFLQKALIKKPQDPETLRLLGLSLRR